MYLVPRRVRDRFVGRTFLPAMTVGSGATAYAGLLCWSCLPARYDGGGAVRPINGLGRVLP